MLNAPPHLLAQIVEEGDWKHRQLALFHTDRPCYFLYYLCYQSQNYASILGKAQCPIGVRLCLLPSYAAHGKGSPYSLPASGKERPPHCGGHFMTAASKTSPPAVTIARYLKILIRAHLTFAASVWRAFKLLHIPEDLHKAQTIHRDLICKLWSTMPQYSCPGLTDEIHMRSYQNSVGVLLLETYTFTRDTSVLDPSPWAVKEGGRRRRWVTPRPPSLSCACVLHLVHIILQGQSSCNINF